MKSIPVFIIVFFTGAALANESVSNCTPTPVTDISMNVSKKDHPAKIQKKKVHQEKSVPVPVSITKTAEADIQAVSQTAETQVRPRAGMSELKNIIIGRNINSVTFGAGWMSDNFSSEVPPYPGFEVKTIDSEWSAQAFLNYFPSTKIALGASYNDRRITNELSYNGSSFDRTVQRSPIELSMRYYPFDFKHLFYAGIGGKMLFVEGNYQMGGEKYYNYGTGVRRIFMFGADVPLSFFTGKIAGFDFGTRIEYQVFDDTVTSPLPEIGNVVFHENNRWLIQGTLSFDWGDWETGY